jgi:hypothetical protein
MLVTQCKFELTNVIKESDLCRTTRSRSFWLDVGKCVAMAMTEIDKPVQIQSPSPSGRNKSRVAVSQMEKIDDDASRQLTCISIRLTTPMA